jgi:hypothetical protein
VTKKNREAGRLRLSGATTVVEVSTESSAGGGVDEGEKPG